MVPAREGPSRHQPTSPGCRPRPQPRSSPGPQAPRVGDARRPNLLRARPRSAGIASRFRSRRLPGQTRGEVPRLPAPPGAGTVPAPTPRRPGPGPRAAPHPPIRSPSGRLPFVAGSMNGPRRGRVERGGGPERRQPRPRRAPLGRRAVGGARGGPARPRGAAPRRFLLARPRGRLGVRRATIGRRRAGGVSSEWEGAAAPPLGTLIHYNFFFLLLSPPDLSSGGGGGGGADGCC